MAIQELLIQIREPWLQRVSQALARGSGVRESFGEQLVRYYDLMQQAVLTGDVAWVDPILYDWARSPTETDLEQGQYHVAFIVNRMVSLTIEVARDTLDPQDALDFIATILPVFTYSLETVSRYEMETRVAHISSEMTNVQKKMEKLDKSKSNFIAVAAHELKTPLTLIEGYTSMMRDQLLQTEAKGVDNLLRGVDTGINRLRQIVDDMIDVSLIDNHLLSLNWQPVQIWQLLDLLCKELQPIVDERQQELDIRKFSGSDTWLYADPERIYQALHNLLNNAIKFTPDRGKITVHGRTLPGFIEITVADTGIGISSENQALIFEKFGQLGQANLHSSGKTKFKGGGPGLGLAIARGIIEAHGGTIWVESDGYDEVKMPGSTFHVLLPSRTQATDPRIAKLFDTLEPTVEPNDKEVSRTDHPAT